MGNIYGSADRVLIWLGSPAYHLNMLARFLKGESQWSVTGNATIERAHYNCAISDVLSRPWWRRVWVVQEVSRARRAPVICLGSHEHIDLLEFAKRVRVLESAADLQQVQVLLDIRARTRTPPRLRDRNIDNDGVQAGRHRLQEDLMYLLDATTKVDSTVTRDKIFALLTLIRGNEGNRFRPDYNMTMQQVYTTVSAELLTGVAGLELLNRRWGAQLDDLPSWVPDFSVTSITMVIFPSPSQYKSKVRSNKAPRMENEQQQGVLVVPGFLVDSVCRVLSVDLSETDISMTSAVRRFNPGCGIHLDKARAYISNVHPELLQVVSFAVESTGASSAVALARRLIRGAQGVDVQGLHDSINLLESLVTSTKKLEQDVAGILPRVQQLKQHERQFIDAICEFADLSIRLIRQGRIIYSNIFEVSVHGMSGTMARNDDLHKIQKAVSDLPRIQKEDLAQSGDETMRLVRELLVSINGIIGRLVRAENDRIYSARDVMRDIYPAILLFKGLPASKALAQKP